MERVFYAKTRQTDRRPTRGSALSSPWLFFFIGGHKSIVLYCVRIYIYIRVYLYVRTSVDYTAYCMVGNKTTGRPYNKPSSSFTGFCPLLLFFFIWYPVGGLCVSPLLAFSTLFSRLADSFPLNRIHRNHIGRLIFNGPQNVWNSFCYLFSLSLSFSPLSLFVQNKTQSVSLS